MRATLGWTKFKNVADYVRQGAQRWWWQNWPFVIAPIAPALPVCFVYQVWKNDSVSHRLWLWSLLLVGLLASGLWGLVLVRLLASGLSVLWDVLELDLSGWMSYVVILLKGLGVLILWSGVSVASLSLVIGFTFGGEFLEHNRYAFNVLTGRENSRVTTEHRTEYDFEWIYFMEPMVVLNDAPLTDLDALYLVFFERSEALRRVSVIVHADILDYQTITWEVPTSERKDIYEWKKNGLSGQATGTWPDGRRYVGQWMSGCPDGHGTMTWPRGETYVGEWKHGRMWGQGTYTCPYLYGRSGYKCVGKFIEDALWRGTKYDNDGNAIFQCHS